MLLHDIQRMQPANRKISAKVIPAPLKLQFILLSNLVALRLIIPAFDDRQRATAAQ